MTFGECFAAIAAMANGSIKVEVHCWRYDHLREPHVAWEAWIATRSETFSATTPELLVERVRDAMLSKAPAGEMRPEQVQA